MTEEKRTPTAWARNCLSILQEINPSYRKNRETKGRFIEFIREDDSGLIISHNFIKIQNDYYYSFALTFLTRPTELLKHCMIIGSRFDHNCTIWRQFLDHMGLFRGDSGYPSAVWSFGPWRKNTIEKLQHGLSIPEDYLLPFYRRTLLEGKNAMVILFEDTRRVLDRIPIDADNESIAELIEPELSQAQNFQRECSSLDGFNIARGGECKYSHGPPEPGFSVKNIPNAAIVGSQFSLFLQERDRLVDIIEIAKGL